MKTIRCEDCGRDVLVDGSFVSICDYCGAEYNTFGQRLAPREEWGWDTGESLIDITKEGE